LHFLCEAAVKRGGEDRSMYNFKLRTTLGPGSTSRHPREVPESSFQSLSILIYI
jgi:hypothetical protein